MSDPAPSNAGYTYRARIAPIDAGRSLVDFLVRTYDHSDRAAWAARLAAGELAIEGTTVSVDRVLRTGEVVTWARPPWFEAEVPRDVPVLYEDDDLLAVSKPSGLPTMPGGGFLAHTLLAFVTKDHPGASPLHRLGRGTSGLVLFAKTTEAARVLLADFRERRIGKTYRALASGLLVTDHVPVAVPIGEVAHPLLGLLWAASGAGKPSSSVVDVVERRTYDTLVDVAIHTGRPHQIRIHLAAIGHPLVGDPLYVAGGGPAPGSTVLPGELGYALHAHRLSFTHPVSRAALTIIAAPPEVLVAATDAQPSTS